jgi:hypothetical protein
MDTVPSQKIVYTPKHTNCQMVTIRLCPRGDVQQLLVRERQRVYFGGFGQQGNTRVKPLLCRPPSSANLHAEARRDTESDTEPAPVAEPVEATVPEASRLSAPSAHQSLCRDTQGGILSSLPPYLRVRTIEEEQKVSTAALSSKHMKQKALPERAGTMF